MRLRFNQKQTRNSGGLVGRMQTALATAAAGRANKLTGV